MILTEVRVPQLGEGLYEVLLVHFLKKPGDPVARDEKLYVIETDKATVEVESPSGGWLHAWLATEGSVVPVNAPVAQIQTQPQEGEVSDGPHGGARPGRAEGLPPSRTRGRVAVPPRVRAYCREQGLGEDEIRQIPARGDKLMPEDVTAYLSARTARAGGAAAFRDRPLPCSQRAFVYRARRSAQQVLPATITRPLAWDRVQEVLTALRRRYAPRTFSDFEVLAYQAARASAEHPKFRSVLLGDDRVREYEHVNLGIAVQRPGDELVTAVVPHADTLDFPTFVERVQQQVAVALDGVDQATEHVQLLVTYLAGSGVTAGVPLLMAPAVAVLFVGSPYPPDRQPVANLTLTFDHRLINGVAAAQFLQRLAQLAEQDSSPGREEAPERPPAMRSGLPVDSAARTAGQLDELVREAVGRLLGVPAETIPCDTPLRLVGLDSFQSVALAQQLDAVLGVGLTASLVWNYPTVESLVEYLVRKVAPAAGDAGPDSVRERELLEQLRNLSEEEAAALIAAYGRTL